MIKINLKESILNTIEDIEEVEHRSIVTAINNPECHNLSFYDDVSFEDIVIFRKALIDFEIMYQTTEFIEARHNLLKLMNKLIIERVERIKVVEENK